MPEPVKLINMHQAHAIAKEYGVEVSLQTIHLWVAKKHLGFQPSGHGGHWRIFEEKFRVHVSGINALNRED